MIDFYESLNDEQKKYFNHYKSNDCYLDSSFFASDLNDLLRKGSLKTEWRKACEILDEIVKINSLDSQSILYRATAYEIIERFIKDDKLTYPAYISTGEDRECVKTHFKNVSGHEIPALLRITCPTGTGFARFESDTTSGTEKEILLGRGHVFLITENKEITDKSTINHVMDPDLAIGFNTIRIIDLLLIG